VAHPMLCAEPLKIPLTKLSEITAELFSGSRH
jgi:hypothetical protein